MDSLSTNAALRNNILVFMKRHGDQVRTNQIMSSPDIEKMQIDSNRIHAYVGMTMKKLHDEGEVIRITSHDPRYPQSKYAYRLPEKGEIVSSEPTLNLNNGDTVMSEALKKAGISPKAKVGRPSARGRAKRDAVPAAAPESTLSYVLQRSNENLTSALPSLNLMVDKDGRGVTLTLAGIAIHLSVAP